MKIRSLLAVVAGATLLCLGGVASQSVSSSEPWLDLPQISQRIGIDGSIELAEAPASIQQLVFHIPAGGSRVNYGSIHTKVNTESTDVAMKSSSGLDGLVLNVDLTGAGGFPMQHGRNSVELEYQDQFGRTKYYNFLLDFGGPANSANPQGRGFETIPTKTAPEKRPGRLFAVVIGISHYVKSDGQINDLQFADRDATAMLEFLRSPAGGGVTDEDSLLLLNGDATTQNIRHALFTFLTKPQEQDTVVIYIAGHGAPDPLDQRNLYLLTADSKPDDMGGTAFPMWQLQDVFERVLKAKRVLTFADTCHSYGFSGSRTGPGAKHANNLVNQYLQRYASKGQRAVITASDISESSFEDLKWGEGHGVYTYFLLRGLKGEADLNHDGTVTAGELFAYLKQSVPQATAGKQNPRAVVGIASGLTVSSVGRTRARLELPVIPTAK
ncbi:MAG: caspase family protein [Acidobacteriota bacterium]|nr:caspase family protein [Acidobacteriota bacterium]